MLRHPLALLLLAIAACSGGGDDPAPTTTTAPPEVPAELEAFLDDVAPHAAVPFTATYEVLQKLGGETVTVQVSVTPPSWRIEVEDVVVTPEETCVDGTCTDGVLEQQLTQFGFTSRFFSTAPARQLETDARRAGAGRPDLTTRTVAGVDLRCAAVPVGVNAPTTACLTPEGVFGYVDDPARRVTLVEYAPA